MQVWRRLSPQKRARAMADYETGYKKPPKHSQFMKGQRANPKGRPKRAPIAAITEAIESVLNDRAEYQERGRTKVVTRRELTVRTLINLALKGNVKSAEALLKLLEHAKLHDDAGIKRILVSAWLPDYPNQMAYEKTMELSKQSLSP